MTKLLAGAICAAAYMALWSVTTTPSHHDMPTVSQLYAELCPQDLTWPDNKGDGPSLCFAI